VCRSAAAFCGNGAAGIFFEGERKMAITYLNTLDFDSAITAATSVIDGRIYPWQPEITEQEVAMSYLYRGIAYCFKPNKEGKHTEAISDLSHAISLGTPPATAYYYRAFAYYLDGNYERAIADCWQCNIRERNGLLGKIYLAMGEYRLAVSW
jgi:tetratricopeptide (TPR) repeat protein